MNILTHILSKIGIAAGKLVYKGFNHYTTEAKATQAAILRKLMKKNANTVIGKKYDFANINNVREYQDKVPLSEYSDYHDYLQRMIQGETNLILAEKPKRYIPTSGSSGAPKIFPVSKKAAWDIQCMGFCGPLGCTALHYEKLDKKLPTMFGMLSFALVRTPMPNNEICCGISAHPLLKLRRFAKYFTTTPDELLFTQEPAKIDFHYAVLRFALPNRDVSYLGSIIITGVLAEFRYIEENWEMLCDDIEKGTINESIRMPDDLRKKLLKRLKPDPKRAEELRVEFRKGFDTPIAKRIWPKLSWMYGMMGGNLAVYIEKLKKYTGDVPIHNMGYGASECLMAIPVELDAPDAVLLPRSAFFEFLPIDAPDGTRPLLLHEVKEGELYEVILTNFSGLYRYQIYDVVKVTGFHNNSPKVQFMYRANLVLNISVEKTTQPMIDEAVRKTASEMGVELSAWCEYADYDSPKPRYMMLLEPITEFDADMLNEFAKRFDENIMSINPFYAKWRKLNTIDQTAAKILQKGTFEGYRQMRIDKGGNPNQMKPVTLINTDEKKDWFFNRVILE
ncbi:MAG TPA: GH3 auxin-responsive promoter family protein [Clostridiales bacterium]|nr:GH3 auxin-responsive promoter family protein [Clostridiales bacterium]